MTRLKSVLLIAPALILISACAGKPDHLRLYGDNNNQLNAGNAWLVLLVSSPNGIVKLELSSESKTYLSPPLTNVTVTLVQLPIADYSIDAIYLNNIRHEWSAYLADRGTAFSIKPNVINYFGTIHSENKRVTVQNDSNELTKLLNRYYPELAHLPVTYSAESSLAHWQ